MREKMIEYADNIINDNDIINIYNELANIFNKEELYSSQVSCIKRLWNLTFDSNLLKKEGDAFLNLLEEPDMALEAYNLYLQEIEPQFYENFMNAIQALGYSEINSYPKKSHTVSDLTKLADKYTAIIDIMMLMHKLKDYEGILILSKYLDKINDLADGYTNSHNYNPKDFHITKERNNYYSYLISSTIKNVDLNILAIKLNDENKQAYLNILEEFINKNQIDESINFYNNCFIPRFDTYDFVNSEICLYWELSKIYSSEEDYFNSIKYQQKAIDTELAQKGEKY